MNNTPRIPQILLGTALITSLPSTLSASTLTDKFTDASGWAKPFIVASDAFKIQVGGGHMNYTSTTARGGGAGISRKSPLLSASKDWSLRVDAHLHAFKLTKFGQFSDVFLGVGKTGDLMENNLMLEFGRGRWGEEGGYYIGDDATVGGNDDEGLFEVPVASSDVSLRMDYSASKRTVTYYFDSNGPADGYVWKKQASANIASGRFNLRMGSKGTFSIFLLGSSELQTVGKGQAWLDNLHITVGAAGNGPAISVQQPSGSMLANGAARKSFGTQPLDGKGLTRVFTIRNDGDEPVTGLSVVVDGSHARDFSITAPAAVTLPPGGTATFKVSFKPTAEGTRTAALHISGDDADESPFDIFLSGQGAK